jgi:glycosyltransferase involved in cell wall biosynthesis
MRGRIGRQVTVAEDDGDQAGGHGGRPAPADRVLHVITSTQRRGAETFAVDLATALGARGVASEVVALAPGAGDTLDVATLGPTGLAPATLRALRRRAAGAPAVVAHGSRTLPACALALAGRRTPVVYRSIGDPGAWAGGPVRRLRTRVLPNGVPADRCPVPDAAARAAARTRLGLPAGVPVVAAIGALSAEKRVADAIDAVAAVEGAHLLVAGDGPERPALEPRAAATLGERAHFAGVLPGPADALAAADVVVSCSRTEGMPGVLIEAGLSGRPAVATDVGGVAEIVRDGETGVLVRPGDVDGLTAALVRALAERSGLGAAARAHCLATFEIGVVADGWADLLRTLGAAARSRA